MATHEWAEQVLGMTLTFVRGAELREIGETLAFRWDTERTTTFEVAEEGQQAEGWLAYAVQVGERDGWTVLVEPNGYAAGGPDVVARLSRGGTAVSLFWTINAAMGFTLARDGVVVRAFDPLLFTLGPEGDPLPEEVGLAFGEPGEPLVQHALTLAERLTGVRLDERWIRDTPRPTWTTRSPRPPMPPGPPAPLIPHTVVLLSVPPGQQLPPGPGESR